MDIHTVLVDGDNVAYRYAHAAQQKRYCVDYKGMTHEFRYKKQATTYLKENHLSTDSLSEVIELLDFKEVKYMLDGFYKRVKAKFKGAKVRTFISDGDKRCKMRYLTATVNPYKGNRKDSNKPEYLEETTRYLFDKYNAEVAPKHLEADDALGMEQTENSVIITTDKDLAQIPGWHASLSDISLVPRFVKDPGIVYIDRDAANKARIKGYGFKWFCAQMICGDIIDGIYGIPKMGPVKTVSLLDPLNDMKDMYLVVKEEYIKRGLEKLFNENGDLLWIARRDHPTLKSFLETIL